MNFLKEDSFLYLLLSLLLGPLMIRLAKGVQDRPELHKVHEPDGESSEVQAHCQQHWSRVEHQLNIDLQVLTVKEGDKIRA